MADEPVPDEPIADVVARVLAVNGHTWDARSRMDVMALAREVQRLTGELGLTASEWLSRYSVVVAEQRAEIARLKALIVDAGHLIGSLGSHAPGDGVTDASTDQCWYCGEMWPCPTAQWREAIR